MPIPDTDELARIAFLTARARAGRIGGGATGAAEAPLFTGGRSPGGLPEMSSAATLANEQVAPGLMPYPGAAGQAGPGGFAQADVEDFFGARGGAGGAGQAGAGALTMPTPPFAQAAPTGRTQLTQRGPTAVQARPVDPAEHEAAMAGRVRAPDVLRGIPGAGSSLPEPSIIMTHPKPTPTPVPTAAPPEPTPDEAMLTELESDAKAEADTVQAMRQENRAAVKARVKKPPYTGLQIKAQEESARESRIRFVGEKRKIADDQKKAVQDQEKAAKAERADAAARQTTLDILDAPPGTRMKRLAEAAKNPDMTAADTASARTFATGLETSDRMAKTAARESAKTRQIADTAEAKAKFVKVWEPTYNIHMTKLEEQLRRAKPQAKEGLVDQTMRSMIQLFRKQREEALKQPPERQEEMLAAAVAQFRTFKGQLPDVARVREPSAEAVTIMKEALASAMEKDAKGNIVPIAPDDRRARQRAYAAVLAAYDGGASAVSYADVQAIERILRPFQSDTITDDDPR